MHAAPPVAVRCTAGWAWRGVQTALPALAAGVFVHWTLAVWAEDGIPAGPRAGLSLLAAAAVGALAWRRSAEPVRTLDWDGQRWALDGRPGPLQLMVDLGPAMLLRHAGRHWLLARRGDVGGAWHALRVAVLARSIDRSAHSHDGGPHA